ncbi:hypothetical protein NQZ68_026412 [Dissostichus eleginoides]|nr:hypothetical protein NQZ68_026412 [Dissostichus eleginoides]
MTDRQGVEAEEERPVAIKLANKLVGWSPGSHSAPGCQPLLRFSSGNHWNYSPDMLWIILLILPGLTPLLLPRSSGSWSLLPGSPALASSVLAPLHRIMPPLYSLSDLHSFNNRLPPDCMDILADNEILRKRHPPHRGSGQQNKLFFLREEEEKCAVSSGQEDRSKNGLRGVAVFLSSPEFLVGSSAAP